MKTIISIIIGVVLLVISFVGGYAYHQPKTQVVKVPVTTKPISQSMTCTGTLTQSLSGQTSPQTAAKTSDQAIMDLYQGQNIAVNGSTPITLTCTPKD